MAAQLAPESWGREKRRTSTLGDAEVAQCHSRSFKHNGNAGMDIFDGYSMTQKDE